VHFLLTYEAGPNYASRRQPHRDEHLRLAREAVDRGELLLGGGVCPGDSADPDGSVLLFRGDSPDVAERFARADPYVTSGVVARWRVQRWLTVVGPLAEAPA